MYLVCCTHPYFSVLAYPAGVIPAVNRLPSRYFAINTTPPLVVDAVVVAGRFFCGIGVAVSGSSRLYVQGGCSFLLLKSYRTLFSDYPHVGPHSILLYK